MGAKAIVEVLDVGPLGCNCTIVGDSASKKAVVVDPGGDVDLIQQVLQKHKLEVTAILITHAHFDHLLSATELKNKCGGKPDVRLNSADNFLWGRWGQQCADFGFGELAALHTVADPDKGAGDNEVITFGELDVRCIHTPGHTPGSTCYYVEDATLLMSGDTLFRGAVGRTSWFGIPSLEGTSDGAQLLDSVRHKLVPLPEETRVITGHGPETSIGLEKRRNPYCRA